MEENNTNNHYIEEEEIDLRELFKIIWQSKKFIILFTFVITLLSVIYVLFKNPIPIYKGTLLVEIGEIKTNDSIFPIDNPNNLKYILEAEAEAEAEVSIPKKTNKLIQINVKDISKEQIENRINTLYKKLIERQNNKIKMYKDYIPTKKIGNIFIDKKVINQPKKKLIVAVSFITAFIVSIFLVFFIQFIKSFNEK